MLDLSEIEIFEQKCRQKTLDCGIRAIHIPSSLDKRFYLGAIFATGSRNEAGHKPGISHFLEHMMFRGSKNYPSFLKLADAFEWLGGEWNAETGHEHTEYSFNGISQTSSKVIELFSDFLKDPMLLDIEIEREVILREIEDEMNEFGNSIDVDWHMAALIWPNTTVAQPIAGTDKTVKGTVLDDLWKYRNLNYSSEQMILCAAGGENSEEIFSDLNKNFSGYGDKFPDWTKKSKPGEFTSCLDQSSKENIPTKITDGPRFKFVKNSDSQYHIQISFPCAGEWSDSSDHYDTICRILADNYSSRLPFKLREELGLVYDIECEPTLFSDAGSIDISVSAVPEKIEPIVKEICLILKEFREGGPTEDEFSKNIHRTLVDISLAANDPESMGFRLAWGALCRRDDLLSSQVKKINSICKEDIRNTSREIFQKTNCAVVVLGPKDKNIKPQIIELIQTHL